MPGALEDEFLLIACRAVKDIAKHSAAGSGRAAARYVIISPRTPQAVHALRFWRRWVSVAYLKGYLDATAAAPFMPATRTELALVLDIYLLEKSIYELGYELNNRPDFSDVPIAGILEILPPVEPR